MIWVDLRAEIRQSEALPSSSVPGTFALTLGAGVKVMALRKSGAEPTWRTYVTEPGKVSKYSRELWDSCGDLLGL